MKHVPNALSLARILVTPAFFVLLLSGRFWGQLAALGLFLFAAASDWLDGTVARRYDAGSRLGQFLDPLADKVLVLGAFVALLFLPPDVQGRPLPVTWWAVALIALRDFAVTALRTYAERRGRTVRTRGAAKVKTGVQLAFLIYVQAFLVASKLGRFGEAEARLGALAADVLYGPVTFVFLLVTVGLTLWTGALYFAGRPPSDS